jgi:hypothetical protein
MNDNISIQVRKALKRIDAAVITELTQLSATHSLATDNTVDHSEMLNNIEGEDIMNKTTRKEAHAQFTNDLIEFFKRGNVVGRKEAKEIYKKHYETQCERTTVFSHHN